MLINKKTIVKKRRHTYHAIFKNIKSLPREKRKGDVRTLVVFDFVDFLREKKNEKDES